MKGVRRMANSRYSRLSRGQLAGLRRSPSNAAFPPGRRFQPAAGASVGAPARWVFQSWRTSQNSTFRTCAQRRCRAAAVAAARSEKFLHVVAFSEKGRAEPARAAQRVARGKIAAFQYLPVTMRHLRILFLSRARTLLCAPFGGICDPRPTRWSS
jgi:hypothetical protein